MLSEEKARTLVGFIEKQKVKSWLAGIINLKKEDALKIDYKKFRDALGLEDLRFHWLTSENAYISGGAVIAWIDSSIVNEDTDFFFTNIDSALRFEKLIQGYECTKLKDSEITRTYTYEDSVLQLVGINDPPRSGGYSSIIGGKAFCDPVTQMERFDFHASMFAVDCDYIYIVPDAIRSLISMKLTKSHNMTVSEGRFKKYIKKGFEPVDRVIYGDDGARSWY